MLLIKVNSQRSGLCGRCMEIVETMQRGIMNCRTEISNCTLKISADGISTRKRRVQNQSFRIIFTNTDMGTFKIRHLEHSICQVSNVVGLRQATQRYLKFGPGLNSQRSKSRENRFGCLEKLFV